MKKFLFLCFVIVMLVSGCSKNTKETNENTESIPNEHKEILVGIANDLNANSDNYSMESITSNVLSGSSYYIQFPEDYYIQVFIYDTKEAADDDLSCLSNNGSVYTKNDGDMTISTSVDWVSTPHFFQEDHVIILYVGNDQDILEQLTNYYDSHKITK